MKLEHCQNHKLFVAESNSEVVGWCRSFPVDCSGIPSHAELGIGLLTKYRDQGIGSELVMRSLEWAAAAGVQIVDLLVVPGNIIAIHVFQKCGFIPLCVQGNLMSMSVCLS